MPVPFQQLLFGFGAVVILYIPLFIASWRNPGCLDGQENDQGYRW